MARLRGMTPAELELFEESVRAGRITVITGYMVSLPMAPVVMPVSWDNRRRPAHFSFEGLPIPDGN